MDENEEFILKIDCLLEIIKYVIADCEAERSYCELLKYNDLINFVLAHEFFLELLKTHHKHLYADLEMPLVCRITKILIDRRVNKSSNGNEYFWKSLLQSINQKSPFYVRLSFDDVSIYARITSILDKHLSYDYTEKKNVNISSEMLIDICQWNQNLRSLSFEDTEIQGSPSDFAPHCGNLEELRIKLNPENGVAQYASFAKLPHFKSFIITGVESGSQLLFFNDLKKWPKSLTPLTLTIEYIMTEKRTSITFATLKSLKSLKTKSIDFFKYGKHCVLFKAEYDLCKISEENFSIEESLANNIFDRNVFIKFDRNKGELQLKIDQNSYIGQMGSLSKLPNLSCLIINNACERNPSTLAQFLRSMVPNGSFALKYCIITKGSVNQLVCLELAKINSIRLLACEFSELDLVKFLKPLTNLQYLVIDAQKSTNFNTSDVVSSMLNACQVHATLNCHDFKIILNKIKKTMVVLMYTECKADILTLLALLKDVNTLEISGWPTGSLNPLFDVIATSNLSAIEELNIRYLHDKSFEDVSKVSEMQNIKKLSCSFTNFAGIESLADLNNLEDLTISGEGNLAPLFKKLADRNRVQRIHLLKKIVPEEVKTLSQIRSMKKLHCRFTELEDLQSLSELANSSVEDLIVNLSSPSNSLQKLFAAFSSSTTTRLQCLEIFYKTDDTASCKTLDTTEMSEISKIKGLKKLSAGFINAECTQMLVRLPNLEHLVIKHVWQYEISPLEHLLWDSVHKSPSTLRKLDLKFWIGFNECNSVSQLETLESLSCKLNEEPGIEILANIKKLKELIIYKAEGSLSKLFRAFALKSESTLQELHTPIICSDEIREISHIESLLKLNIYNKRGINFWLNPPNGHNSLNIDSNILLPIFQSCQKLDCVTFDFESGVAMASNFVSEVNTILKSIRNSSLQKPLKLALLGKSTSSKFHLEDIDEAFLTVSYSTSDLYNAVGLSYDSSESYSNDSDIANPDEYELNNFNLFSG
ncbi:uncharacterized protein LOC108051054 [Drosophila rhopaloa]|uniref:Uncharacterized protein n=1 Tax=Drosophila rhopaloa TaxID=1041015 RepID=A0ABM5I156_DRORH|nr:uncharacterized protein LOC108051054 [Drosophila rhopaloa]